MHFRILLIASALVLWPVGTSAQAPPAAVVEQVRVHAHVVLVDRREAARVGLGYVQLGGGLMGVEDARARGGIGARGSAGGVPISAFLDVARQRGVLRSDTRSQVLVVSGGSGAIASGTVGVGRWGTTRVRGPELVVSPTVLEDGRVQLDVRVRLRDEVTGVYGYGVDGSPVDVWTTVAVWPGEEATVGSMSASTQRSDTGLLYWSSESGDLDVLVVLRPELSPTAARPPPPARRARS
jgi:hypothetical protein